MGVPEKWRVIYGVSPTLSNMKNEVVRKLSRMKKYKQLLLAGLIIRREMISAQRTHHFWTHDIRKVGLNKGHITTLFKN